MSIMRRRFTEEEFKELIEQAEKHYRAKPTATELTNYYNRFVLSENDFKNPDEYESKKVSRYVIHYYIKTYKCGDLLSIYKPKHNHKKKNPDTEIE